MENNTADCGNVDCGSCVRRDVAVITDSNVNIVTYVGDYVVTTIVSPELQDPIARMLQLTGLLKVPAFTVIVGYVGQGSIKESQDSVPDDEYMRFVERHSNLEGVQESHDMVVEQVRSGILDLSQPVTAEQMAKESSGYFQDALDAMKSDDPFGDGFKL